MFRCLERSIPLLRFAFAAWIVLHVAGCSYHPAVCGLRPLSPDLTAGAVSDSLIFTEIDSLQPTLRWESFPRHSDLHADRQGVLIKAAQDVSYELRIWRVEDNSAIRRVYERRELTTPKHRVDVRLDPNARYFWSVRAKFRAGEETRVIPWGFSKVPSVPGLVFCVTPGDIPHANYYRFQTPTQ